MEGTGGKRKGSHDDGAASGGVVEESTIVAAASRGWRCETLLDGWRNALVLAALEIRSNLITREVNEVILSVVTRSLFVMGAHRSLELGRVGYS